MAKIELVKRVKYAGDIHKKLVELGWDLDTADLFCDDLPDADVAPVRRAEVDGYEGLEMANESRLIDAVKVVHCRSCKFYQTFGHEDKPFFQKFFGLMMKPDDFCSYDKRKEV